METLGSHTALAFLLDPAPKTSLTGRGFSVQRGSSTECYGCFWCHLALHIFKGVSQGRDAAPEALIRLDTCKETLIGLGDRVGEHAMVLLCFHLCASPLLLHLLLMQMESAIRSIKMTVSH